MTLSLILAFIQSNSTTILGIWLLVEQLLANNSKIKANSTFQLVSNLVKALLNKKTA